ncbi:MAG: DUF2029 domain-containing protein [Alphaproteobacteria bacterium]|nr:DUF2029 domain-containing protein [Alphaproteobacteria bacterium]
MDGRTLVGPASGRLQRDQLVRIILAALLCCFALFYFRYGLAPGPLNDYGSFWASGKAANEGLNPYAVYPETFRSPATGHVHPNLNPPASLLLLAPLARLDPHATLTALWWGGLLVYTGIVVLTLWRHPQPNGLVLGAWALALPALWDGLRLGQVYVLLFAGVALVWYLLENERPLLAAVAIGCLAAFKPNLLLWPALLFAAGHRRMAVVAFLSFGVAGALPLLVFGTEVYAQWLELLRGDVAGRSGFFANATVVAIGVRAGSHLLGGILAALVLAWAILHVRRRQLSGMQASAIGVGVAILASPVAWLHYLLLLLPALLHQRWTLGIAAGAAVMVIPTVAAFWAFRTLPLSWPELAPAIKATIGSAYSWGALLLVASMARADGAVPETGKTSR